MARARRRRQAPAVPARNKYSINVQHVCDYLWHVAAEHLDGVYAEANTRMAALGLKHDPSAAPKRTPGRPTGRMAGIVTWLRHAGTADGAAVQAIHAVLHRRLE
jgi:hypothetical protein